MLWVDWCFALKLKSSPMILLSKLPVDGTRNGNDATWSACEQKQLWPNNCLPTSKRTLCGFIASSLQQENAATTLYPASTTWMRHPWVLSCPWTNTGIQWEPKSASKILRSGKAELHRRSCCCCQWSKGAHQKSSSKASIHQEIWLCRCLFVFPSIRNGGWMNRAWSSETLTSQLSLEA